MRKARRYKQLPQAPNNVQDFDNILNNTNMFRIHSGSRRDPFYQTTLTLNDDSVCVIFMHMKTIETIGHIEEIHINDDINGQSDIQLTHHLLVVHAVKNYYVCMIYIPLKTQIAPTFSIINFYSCWFFVVVLQQVPILYAISAIKTQAIYAVIFAYIRENLSAYITPTTIMSDFDPETQLALAYTFPDASIKGFWFHYTDSLLKYIESIRLQWNKNMRCNTSSCLRMLMVLPLLPAEYSKPGLQAIRKWAMEKSIMNASLERLCSFIEYDWLRSVGADKMSIFGLPHGVFNYVQLFNNEFRQSLINSQQQQQQSIWHILGTFASFVCDLDIWKLISLFLFSALCLSFSECITHLATRTYMKCNKRQQQQSSASDTIKPNKRQRVLETIVKNATQMWCSNPIHLRNPLQFLQLSSHCINDTFMEASQVQLTIESSEAHINNCATTAPADNSDDDMDYEQSFNSIKSNAPNQKTKSSTIKDFKKSNGGSNNVDTAAHMIEYVNLQQINSNNCARVEPSAPSMIVQSNSIGNEVNLHKSEPPPLAFYPKNRGNLRTPIIFSATEPPPLVPIARY